MSESIYDRISAKRKKLQSEGLVPEWYTTAALQMFDEKYEYQTNGRSVRGQFERIAKTAAKHVKKELPEAEGKFLNCYGTAGFHQVPCFRQYGDDSWYACVM